MGSVPYRHTPINRFPTQYSTLHPHTAGYLPRYSIISHILTSIHLYMSMSTYSGNIGKLRLARYIRSIGDALRRRGRRDEKLSTALFINRGHGRVLTTVNMSLVDN